MTFELSTAIEILRRTPTTLDSLLNGISDVWTASKEGENTWSPYDVIGHLIHGEKTDWMIRTKIILSDSDDKTFEAFDRFAQMSCTPKLSLSELLKEFRLRREANIEELLALQLTDEDYDKRGIHPELGEATLRELLSTWVVHDLGHISQIVRVMAKQYNSEVGPWSQYLTILT